MGTIFLHTQGSTPAWELPKTKPRPTRTRVNSFGLFLSWFQLPTYFDDLSNLLYNTSSKLFYPQKTGNSGSNNRNNRQNQNNNRNNNNNNNNQGTCGFYFPCYNRSLSPHTQETRTTTTGTTTAAAAAGVDVDGVDGADVVVETTGDSHEARTPRTKMQTTTCVQGF